MPQSSAPTTRRVSPPRTAVLLRLQFAGVEPLLGPGKIELLGRIDEAGSISAASRAMHVSYHRAWTIVNEMNAMFCKPLIQTQLGGAAGGGATVTEFGREVVRHYRSIESSLWEHAAVHIAALEAAAVVR
jgi:molybdate transport system regulatory protein